MIFCYFYLYSCFVSEKHQTLPVPLGYSCISLMLKINCNVSDIPNNKSRYFAYFQQRILTVFCCILILPDHILDGLRKYSRQISLLVQNKLAAWQKLSHKDKWQVQPTT